MELLAPITGVTKTNEIRCTKSISALLICHSETIDSLSNQLITLWIERVNRSNVYLATNVRLKDFIALTNFGVESIQSNASFGTIAICELSSNGNVKLNEGEVLKFKLDGLTPAHTVTVYGIEEPLSNHDFHTFDRKTVASEDLQRKISVENTELSIFKTIGVNEIAVEYGNGTSIRYSPFELMVISRDVDTVFAIDDTGVIVQGLPDTIILPTIGVASLEFQKNAGTLIEVTSRVTKNLLDIE